MKRAAAGVVGICVWLAGLISANAQTELERLIEATPKNGVLILENKVYQGNVVIGKAITIKGSGQTTLQGDGTGNVVTIEADNVQLENLAVTHGSMSRNSSEEYSAIKVHSDHNRLRNLVVSDAFHGVTLLYAHDNEITGIKVSGKGGAEIGGQGNGIQMLHSNRNRLINNRIDQTRDGIYFYYSDENQCEGSEITNTRYGLHYMYSDGNRFFRNRFIRNTGGAAIMHSSKIVLRENQFIFNEGTRAFGLMLQASDDNEVIGNRFVQNQRGLYLDQAQRNRIIGNQFFHNQIGVELWASSADQVFSENRFQKNTASVLLIGGESRNSWSEAGKGNDWGEIPLLDLNRDGIGDSPVQYRSALNKLVEENELAYLFLNSPAIKLYEKLEEIMQNRDVMVEDRFPLASGKEPIGVIAPAAALIFAMTAVAGAMRVIRRRKA